MARSTEAAREETAAATHRHAQSFVPPPEQGRGAARTVKAPQTPVGQVVEGENEEEAEEEINANPTQSPMDIDENNRQQEAPLLQEPTIAEAMASQAQLLQQLVQIVTHN